MSLNSKFSNIRHSIRYKSLQPFKFFILKKRYKKNREIAISLLSSDSLVVEIEKSMLKNKFFKEYDEFKKINNKAMEKFSNISKQNRISLHGVQYPELLYIIMRIINPSKVLETGVWLGLSTNSILASGIKSSKNFILDSIDLPRSDIADAENYIGILVDDEFKTNWRLYLGKDRTFARQLITEHKYSFYYFDSDKSLSGKLFLLNEVLKNTKDYLMIFDDLEDNLFWYRNELEHLNKIAIKYGNKYLGLIYSRNYEEKIREIHE